MNNIIQLNKDEQYKISGYALNSAISDYMKRKESVNQNDFRRTFIGEIDRNESELRKQSR